MENSLKGLMLAAGTIITCVIVTLGFFIAKEAKQTATEGAGQINRLNMEFAESDKVVYDGAVVSGSEVLNAIKSMEDDALGVYVTTAKSSTYYGYSFDLSTGALGKENNNTYTIATNKSADTYINPYANFMGKVVRDENDVITGIVFTQ